MYQACSRTVEAARQEGILFVALTLLGFKRRFSSPM